MQSIKMHILWCIAVFLLVQVGESATTQEREETLQRLNNLEKRQKQQDETLAGIHTLQEGLINGIREKLQEQNEMILNQQNDLSLLRNAPKHIITKGYAPGNVNVGFTAFLEKSVIPGAGQRIVYEKVLTNEGLGYNPNTGAFTCPVSGLYMFQFSIYTRNINQAWARLVVNGVPKVDGATESFDKTADSQGGGFAVLRLWAGDVVSIHAFDESSNYNFFVYTGSRLNTFSGALLFSYN